MGLKEWLFNPYEEPEGGKYVKNEKGIDIFNVMLAAFPIAGLGVIIIECYERATGNPTVNNNFNIDNVAWNSMVIGAAFQLFYLTLFLVAVFVL